MAYTYTAFGSIALPTYNIEQDLGTGEVESALLTTANGRSVNYLGDLRRLPRSQAINVQGICYEEEDTIADESDDSIVDGGGDAFLTGTAGSLLQLKLDLLRGATGSIDKLYRKDVETDALRWKSSRLLSVQQPKSYRDRGLLSNITAIFESSQLRWKAQTISTKTQTLTAGGNVVIVNAAGAESVDDALITFTAASTAVGSIRIVLGGADLSWTGNLIPGTSLVLDCGKMTILNNGTDAYSGLDLSPSHSLAGWLRLLPESNEITVTVDVGCDIKVEHYDQWM